MSDDTVVLFEDTNFPLHSAKATKRSDDTWLVLCTCDARWVCGENRNLDYVEETYKSHLKYFNRPKMETL